MTKTVKASAPHPRRLARTADFELLAPNTDLDRRELRFKAIDATVDAESAGAFTLRCSVQAEPWRKFLCQAIAAELLIQMPEDSPWRDAVNAHLLELALIVEGLADGSSPFKSMVAACSGDIKPSGDLLATIFSARILGAGRRVASLGAELPYSEFVTIMSRLAELATDVDSA